MTCGTKMKHSHIVTFDVQEILLVNITIVSAHCDCEGDMCSDFDHVFMLIFIR